MIFLSLNRVFSTLKLTAGAGYEQKIQKNSRRFAKYFQLSSQFSLNSVGEDFFNRVLYNWDILESRFFELKSHF